MGFAIMVVGIAIVNMAAGFLAGRLYERIEWNKKIHSGAIPRPGKGEANEV